MKKSLLTFAFVLFLATFAAAQAFVYRPNNPAFGGNTFNYAWMLSSAQAQDTFKDPTTVTNAGFAASNQDPLKSFTDNLSRSILSQLSRQLSAGSTFGEGGLQTGTYQYGDLTVNVAPGGDGLVVRITDGKGGETTITVPYF